MAYLVFVRHGQSEWNVVGKWTGWTDTELTEQGRAEAREAAKTLESMTFHRGYTSDQKRAKHTLEEIKAALGHTADGAKGELPTTHHPELKERDYGDYTGKNKWEVQQEIGDEEFTKLRRGWDHLVPNGETLKDVQARTLPFYEQTILKDLKQGKNVIVAAHGNSLRSLMKHLEEIEDDKAHEVAIGTAGVVVYEIDETGKVLGKEVLFEGGKA